MSGFNEQAAQTLEGKLKPDRRPSVAELEERGVYHTEIEARSEHLQHELAGASVSRKLDRRPSVGELEERGIYQTPIEARGHELEREITEDRLEKKLAPEKRLSIKELEQKGIYKTDIGGKSTELEHQMAASRLSHKLGERRPSIQELSDKGIIKDADAATVQRDLAAGQLNHDLAYRPSKDQLANGGILKTPEQEEAEERARAAVASEVAAKLGGARRPSVQMLVEQGILPPASE